ncbi:glycoside hydrolase family 3 N-terminal domain-containing protein [Microbacterium sp. ProA8]|uniref:glycoside hydrolase family 3 C-terminal domain-containing protein n=1 Tax=Microbacterium chionoecetis TaxID=3153754 RepID=UPI00326759C5
MNRTGAMEPGLTLEQAASLLSGLDMDTTRALPALGVPPVKMTDGSNGLAMNLPHFAGKVAATCYPTLSAMAPTWDVDLVTRVAEAIAVDARKAGAQVLLGPGMNIKRSPLGGRNFEYFSEDPHLTGRLATAFVRGVQRAGVGACVKHFAANNQETDRMRVSADVGPRALREIYLRAFEQVVTEAEPWLVMASYNRVNGTYATQHRWLLTDVLRDEWGFEGAVVSDWGAVDDRVAALAAGLDLEMPSTSGASDALVLAAVENGTLDEATVRASAQRIVELARKAATSARRDDHAAESSAVDLGAAALATEAAERAAVLLRNERGVLPLRADATVAVVGAFAQAPRFQGGGSAGVNAAQPPAALVDALAAAHRGVITFSPGYADEGVTTDADALARAKAAVSAADVGVVAVGLPEAAESEGYDRTTLALPGAQLRLLEELVDAGTPLVVVCIAGGVVDLEPWREQVDAIILPGLAGQGVSEALARLLTGAVSPSGRLAETIPLALSDTPSHLSFPATSESGAYGEDIFVGYRGYDELGRDVAFPFGHGLTYSEFAYSDAAVRATEDGWECSLVVRNIGGFAARDVVQLYLGAPTDAARRAPSELIGFGAAELAPGESTRVVIQVGQRAFARWDEPRGWVTDAGTHALRFARSSRDIIATVDLEVAASGAPAELTAESTLSEWLDHPVVGPRLLARVGELDTVGNTIGLLSDPTARLMIGGLPIKRLTVDAGNVLSSELLDEVRRA